MSIFLLLFGCFLLIVPAAYWLSWRMQRIDALRAHSIVSVAGVDARYPDLPLKNYGIASRVNANSGRVQVLFPKLTPHGDVEYFFSWHYIRDVSPLATDNEMLHTDSIQHTACEVLPVIRDHLEFEQDALHLNEQHQRLTRLASLVATSSFYSNQFDVYERALTEIDTALLKARDLHKLYIRLVREALIGVQIAGYDPSNIRGDRLTFESEHRRLREEYLYLKDLTAAYTELNLESQGLPDNFEGDTTRPADDLPQTEAEPDRPS